MLSDVSKSSYMFILLILLSICNAFVVWYIYMYLESFSHVVNNMVYNWFSFIMLINVHSYIVTLLAIQASQ